MNKRSIIAIIALGVVIALASAFTPSNSKEDVSPIGKPAATADPATQGAYEAFLEIPVGTEIQFTYSDGTSQAVQLTEELKQEVLNEMLTRKAKASFEDCNTGSGGQISCFNHTYWCCYRSAWNMFCYPMGGECGSGTIQ